MRSDAGSETEEHYDEKKEKEWHLMNNEIVFIDEDTLTPEEWEAISDEQAEE